MNNKEKLPKLIAVYNPKNPLSRRQLPLVVDDNLTLVMDVRGSGIVCDNPLVRGKELDEFTRKWVTLTDQELNSALQITKSELMNVLNQNVPCVGCRRSVERLYYQYSKFDYPTLDPLMVKSDGTITIRAEKQAIPQVLCSIFHDHSARLAKLIENQPKRNKKSLRCFLHSLDSQRSRPLTPVWRDVWDCMKPECKKNVCLIDAPSLHSTLETYLRKHRFCAECRTKVLKAYSLLVEEPEPCKEKGYVSSLYSGIKRCLSDKHIHLQTKTDYITKLISRAEPELLGSRRERHAKTLEIAQEEVLTCLGICMYERLHRIYMRMREEECTCQVFAAVAVDTLSRSFETAVERKQGISQLELLYAELTREEQQKQIRKEQKKIKRKRKKGGGMMMMMGGGGGKTIAGHDEDDDDGKENCIENCGDDDDDYDEKDDLIIIDNNKEDSCSCSQQQQEENNKNNDNNDNNCCYSCEQMLSPLKKSGLLLKCSKEENLHNCNNTSLVVSKQDKLRCNGNELWIDDCKCENDIKENNKKNNYKCNNYIKDNGILSTSDHSHDCGYSSENNNGCCETGSLISSISSSPEGSELACSDSCCQHETDYFSRTRYPFGQYLSLQEMLEDYSEDEDDSLKLTPEEVREFENNNKHLFEKRQELREALKKKFIDFCAYGPLQVPRLLVQTKYASN